jgi:phosphoribosyl-AMP cyclohydrolase
MKRPADTIWRTGVDSGGAVHTLMALRNDCEIDRSDRYRSPQTSGQRRGGYGEVDSV